MALVIVDYTYDPKAKEGMDKLRPAHRKFLAELANKGVVKAAGPAPMGAEHPLALILCDAASPEAALDALAEDPFLAKGYIKTRRAREWTVAVGQIG